MRSSAAGVVIGVVALASCEGAESSTCICDGPPQVIWDDDLGGGCNPIEQIGCGAGEKCTWQRVTDTLGRITCVPDGTVPSGGACTVLAPGENAGFDDCVAGQYCIGGACAEICSRAPDSCDPDTSVCETYAGIFEGADVSTGACAFTCSPGSQTRRFDDAPACGSTPELPLGCYGWAWGPSLMEFVCLPDASDAVHGDAPDPLTPQGMPTVSSCDAGYFPWPAAPHLCTAFCVPGETHAGAPENVDGLAPFTCASRGAVGVGIECRFFHPFTSIPSARHNASGVCIDPAAHVADWDSDPDTPSTPLPRCVDLGTDLIDTDDDGTPDTPEHQHWGCAPWPGSSP